MKTSTTTLAALSAILVSPAVGSAALLDREPDASAAHQPGLDATAQPLQVYAALLARQLPSVDPRQLAAAAAQIAVFHGDNSMDKRDFRSDLEGSLNQALVHLCDSGNMEKLLNQLPANEANQIRSQLAVGCRPDGSFTPVKLPLIGRADPASSSADANQPSVDGDTDVTDDTDDSESESDSTETGPFWLAKRYLPRGLRQCDGKHDSCRRRQNKFHREDTNGKKSSSGGRDRKSNKGHGDEDKCDDHEKDECDRSNNDKSDHKSDRHDKDDCDNHEKDECDRRSNDTSDRHDKSGRHNKSDRKSDRHDKDACNHHDKDECDRRDKSDHNEKSDRKSDRHDKDECDQHDEEEWRRQEKDECDDHPKDRKGRPGKDECDDHVEDRKGRHGEDGSEDRHKDECEHHEEDECSRHCKKGWESTGKREHRGSRSKAGKYNKDDECRGPRSKKLC